MRVAHIITALRAEGAQMMLYKLLSRMERERFDAAVISLSNHGALADKFIRMGVPVYWINMKPGLPTPAAAVRLVNKIRQIKPDLIQGWMYHGNLAAQLAAAFAPARVPVLWNVRGSHFALKDEKPSTAAIVWLNAKLSNLPSRIINNSAASALGHEQRLGYNADKRLVIPNGFDTSVFAPSAAARGSVRAELAVADDTPLVALFARFHPVKDHAAFLEAASILLKSQRQAHFVLAGRGVDVSNECLRQLTNRLGISNNVHMLGERSDMPRLAAAMDIVSLTSRAEGFPNVIGEAMSCGVPCAVTDVGDSAWIVGDTGRVAPPGDAVALAKAWQELFEMSDENRRKLGRLARQRVIENFSLDAVARRYETVYEEAVFRRREKQ